MRTSRTAEWLLRPNVRHSSDSKGGTARTPSRFSEKISPKGPQVSKEKQRSRTQSSIATPDLLRGAASGLVAGLAASFAMDVAQRLLSKLQPPSNSEPA